MAFCDNSRCLNHGYHDEKSTEVPGDSLSGVMVRDGSTESWCLECVDDMTEKCNHHGLVSIYAFCKCADRCPICHDEFCTPDDPETEIDRQSFFENLNK